MFNIDFTGGTLWSRSGSNDKDPAVKPAYRIQRAQLVRRQKASVLPDVTVESLRLSDDKSLARFNIRTTEVNPDKVKTEILRCLRHDSGAGGLSYQRGQGDTRGRTPAGDTTKAAVSCRRHAVCGGPSNTN